MPKISVVMPVFNGEKFIKDSIESTLNQTFTDFEFIIVNDGSTDNTKEIIESYKDRRIKLYNLNKNLGPGMAANVAISYCRGKYIARMDADDIQHPSRLLRQYEFLEQNPKVSLVYSNVDFFPDNEEVANSLSYKYIKSVIERRKNIAINSNEIKEYLYHFFCFAHPATMVRYDVFKKFNYSNLRVFEDYDLFYRMNKMGYIMANLPEKLVEIRVNQSSTTANLQNDHYVETAYQIKIEEIKQLLENDDRKLFIWGAGSFGMKVSQFLESKGYSISGFIDSSKDKQGQFIGEKPIIGLQNIDKKVHKVIIASQPGTIDIIKALKEREFICLQDFLSWC